MIKLYANRVQKNPVYIGWIVTITVILFYTYEYFLRNAPAPMFVYFKETYQASSQQIGMIDAAYYWTYIPMQIVVGTLMDHYGVRRPLFLAIFSCIIGSILFSIDNFFNLVVLGRMLIGFGSAFGFVAVLKTASLWLPKRYFPLAVGLATSLGMLGAITSLVTVTYLIEHVGVNTTFEVSELSGIALLILTYFIVFDKKQHRRPSHAQKRYKMILKTVRVVAFSSQIWLAGLIGLALFLPTQIFGLWGIPYFQHILHFKPQTAANIASSLYWGWIIGSPLVGFITEHTQNRRVVILLGAIGAAILLYLIIYKPLTDAFEISIAMLMLGIFSSVQILAFDIAAQSSGRSHAGTAVAITNMFVMLGGPLQSSVGYFIESFGSSDQPLTQVGFQQAFAIMPTLCLLAGFITLLIRDNAQYD